MFAGIAQLGRRVGAMAFGLLGGFEAGLGSRRLRNFQPSRAHLNTLIAAAGADITARARWLVRNNGYAAPFALKGAVESCAGNVVSSGIKPSSLVADPTVKAAVQRLWLEWTDDPSAGDGGAAGADKKSPKASPTSVVSSAAPPKQRAGGAKAAKTVYAQPYSNARPNTTIRHATHACSPPAPRKSGWLVN